MTRVIASAVVSLEMAWLAISGVFIWANAGEPLFVDTENIDTTGSDRLLAVASLALASIFAITLLALWLPPQRPFVRLGLLMSAAANVVMFALLS